MKATELQRAELKVVLNLLMPGIVRAAAHFVSAVQRQGLGNSREIENCIDELVEVVVAAAESEII